jgi:hypothetical protein
MTVREIKELVLSKGVFAESTLHKLKKTWKLRYRKVHMRRVDIQNEFKAHIEDDSN